MKGAILSGSEVPFHEARLSCGTRFHYLLTPILDARIIVANAVDNVMARGAIAHAVPCIHAGEPRRMMEPEAVPRI
jgi:hypothetical protein